uniref:Rhodopsin n=1 Tax=Oryza brachyantha TaxID=4533 RepID=J3M3G6_ORYBR
MGGAKDEKDRGLFSNLMHGVAGGGGYGYPPQQGYYPPPPTAYPPPPTGYGYGYPPAGYPGSSAPHQGYGSSHGGGNMGPMLAADSVMCILTA